MPSPIPVICDRCRATGAAGEAQFADFGDLLDFEPVPRKIRRVDGWTADRQRAFIAALAVTGSPRQAARAVGKAQWGVDRLREAKGAEGFSAAWDKAMGLAAEKGRHRLAAGISAAIEADARPDLAEAAPSLPEDPAARDEADRAFFETLIRKYMIKLEQEREARIHGCIVEADYCLRQITWLEVAIDMTSGDGFKVLRDYRCDDHELIDIAETPMSQLLDAARRELWVAAGDPPRPEPPDRRLLVDHGRFSSEPTEATWGERELSHEEQRRAFEERHARDAAAQVAWEAEARRDYERRRESDAAHNQEPGPAGQPAPSGDRTDVSRSARAQRRRCRAREREGRPACDLQVDRTDVTNSVRDGPTPEEPPDSATDGDSCSQLSPHKETEK